MVSHSKVATLIHEVLTIEVSGPLKLNHSCSQAFCKFFWGCYDKMMILKEVCYHQVWRHKVYPRLKKHLAEAVDSVTSYYVIYHEATLANLLEVSLFQTIGVLATLSSVG